jgi:hypothetical protein
MNDIKLSNGFLNSGDSIINVNSVSSITINKQKTYEKVSIGIIKKLVKPDNISKIKRKISNIKGLIILCCIIGVTINLLPANYVVDKVKVSLYWSSPFLLFIFIFLVQSVYFKLTAYKRIEDFEDIGVDQFVLSISTSSGDKMLINSLDQIKLTNLRDDIVSHIAATTNKIVNYSVVSDSVTINSDTNNFNTSHIYGDQIVQNINNYETNFSNADKEFLKVDFQNALTNIYKEIIGQNNQQIKQKFEELRVELNTKKPAKYKLVSIFSAIKGISTASDFINAADTVMQGFNLLG